MLAAANKEREGDARGDVRTNLFLAATLLVDGAKPQPARIRNLSPRGALIEAAVVPARRTPVRLVRGDHSIAGRVAWEAGSRAGLEFAGTVSVKAWMAPPANGEQQRVDTLVAQLRAGTPPPPEPPRAVVAPAVPAELELVVRLLEQLGEALATDDHVLVKHGVQLQKIDIAVQMVNAIARTAEGQGGTGARLADLRTSAEQALRSDG